MYACIFMESTTYVREREIVLEREAKPRFSIFTITLRLRVDDAMEMLSVVVLDEKVIRKIPIFLALRVSPC